VIAVRLDFLTLERLSAHGVSTRSQSCR
jgi:hypothetical protein